LSSFYIKKINIWKAYIFKNNNSKADGIENNEVPLIYVEELTGLKFKIPSK
jgi:hypothetical protein